MKNLLTVILVFGLLNLAFGQSFVPTVTPPSPNSASLGKYVDHPVSLYTGIPTISIPIYDLKGRGLNIPISLSYHASGIKVGEVASWVGLGWSLNAGGLITRTIKGLPDEDPSQGFWRVRKDYRDLYGANADNLSYSTVPPGIMQLHLAQAADGNIDLEQDIYMLNAMGRSYKILFKTNGTAFTVPYSDVIIKFDPNVGYPYNNWEVTLEDGTQLSFGGKTQLGSTPHTEFTTSADGSNIASTWHLKKVSLPNANNEVITFSYKATNAVSFDNSFGENDAVKVRTNDSLYVVHGNLKKDVGTKKTSMLQISKISTEVADVNFIVEPNQRMDLDSAYALKEITVVSKEGSKLVERFRFNYEYSDADPGTFAFDQGKAMFKKRLKLKSFDKLGNSATDTLGKQSWKFEYNPLALPSRRSYAQDNFGYYNGAKDNTTLLPQYYLNPTLSTTSTQIKASIGFFPPSHVLGANKIANGTFMQAEMLKKVIYPTKGYSEYNFEPNVDVPTSKEQFAPATTGLVVSTAETPYNTSKDITFNITKLQYGKITFKGTFSASYLAGIDDIVNSITLCNAVLFDPNNLPIAVYSIRKSTVVANNNAFLIEKYINLSKIGTYKLRLVAKDLTNTVPLATDVNLEFGISYQSSLGQSIVSELIGGLRVASIIDYDGPNVKKLEKYFKYEEPLVINKLVADDYLEQVSEYRFDGLASTGGLPSASDNIFVLQLVTIPDFKDLTKSYNVLVYELAPNSSGSTPQGTIPRPYTVYKRNSSSLSFLGAIQGGTVGYGKVTTMYSPSSTTLGKTVTTFSNVLDDYSANPKEIPYPTPDSREMQRGLMLKQSDFHANGQVLREVENQYAYTTETAIAQIKAKRTVMYLDCGAAPYGQGCCVNVNKFCDVAFSSFFMTCIRVNKITSVQREYDTQGQNALESFANYYYTSKINPANGVAFAAMSKTVTNDSKTNVVVGTATNGLDKTYSFDRQKEVIYKYSFDFTDALSTDMVNKNMISSPIEETTVLVKSALGSVSTTPLHWKRTNFATFGYYVLPQNIQTKLGSSTTPVTEATFDNYDANGNLLSYTERNGINTSFTYFGSSDIGKFNLVQTKVVGKGTSLAQTTSFDYFPLVGVKQVTSPNGLYSTYEYDSYNRLSNVRSNGKLVKSYQYGFRQ